MKPKPKPKTHTLESPYSNPVWPVLSSEDEQSILELLCSLLEPIGQYKAHHGELSKGKRSKKRKREDAEALTASKPGIIRGGSLSKPPPPEILIHVRVGFNSIVKCLDPAARSIIDASPNVHTPYPSDEKDQLAIAVVFVDRASVGEIVGSQFPPLVAAASARGTTDVLLVPLPRGSAARLSSKLGIPRAGLIGIGREAPQARPLLRFVAETVAPVKIPWLQESLTQSYQHTRTGIQERAKYH